MSSPPNPGRATGRLPEVRAADGGKGTGVAVPAIPAANHPPAPPQASPFSLFLTELTPLTPPPPLVLGAPFAGDDAALAALGALASPLGLSSVDGTG